MTGSQYGWVVCLRAYPPPPTALYFSDHRPSIMTDLFWSGIGLHFCTPPFRKKEETGFPCWGTAGGWLPASMPPPPRAGGWGAHFLWNVCWKKRHFPSKKKRCDFWHRIHKFLVPFLKWPMFRNLFWAILVHSSGNICGLVPPCAPYVAFFGAILGHGGPILFFNYVSTYFIGYRQEEGSVRLGPP